MILNTIPLEKLSESLGKNLYLNAKRLKKEGKEAEALILFDAATDCLEGELEKAKGEEKKEILEELYDCFGTLSAQSSYPFLKVKLPLRWEDYIQKTCEIAEKLGYE